MPGIEDVKLCYLRICKFLQNSQLFVFKYESNKQGQYYYFRLYKFQNRMNIQRDSKLILHNERIIYNINNCSNGFYDSNFKLNIEDINIEIKWFSQMVVAGFVFFYKMAIINYFYTRQKYFHKIIDENTQMITLISSKKLNFRNLI
ncbi:unnamed protein product [Paramecium sonneborni]|uniref:Transmembrane protein n=1 Tax=Paramecium sonneborni TaxID=65129 RepID=A0A8S1RUS6_9CILI|nr:unnamed protein product [Paramecium sonneborni]